MLKILSLLAISLLLGACGNQPGETRGLETRLAQRNSDADLYLSNSQPVPGASRFEEETGIHFFYSPNDFQQKTFGNISGIRLRDAYTMSKKVMRILKTFPVELLRKSGAGILIVKDIPKADAFTASTVFPDNTSLIVLKTWRDGSFQIDEGTVFHEFFHTLDQKLNPSSARGFGEWNALNSTDFAYQSDQSKWDTTYNQYRDDFVSVYSTSSPWEDRAECFRYLLTNGAIEIWTTAQIKPVLKAKFIQIQNFVNGLSREMKATWPIVL